MRLWHYKLIEYLPNSQLLAQWRELNSIFKKQDKHILINYIYEYPKEDLYAYTGMVAKEMQNRGYKIKTMDNVNEYFKEFSIHKRFIIVHTRNEPFKHHHDLVYLEICWYNLYEKYLRGQKDFKPYYMDKMTTLLKKERMKEVHKDEII